MRNIAVNGAKPEPKEIPTPEAIAAAEKAVLEAAAAVDKLIADANFFTNEQRKARAMVANATRAWLHKVPRLTEDELKRDFIAQGNTERADKANGQPSAPQPERRVYLNPIDGRGLQDNSAEGFARSMMKNGSRRGAFSKEVRGGKIGPVIDPATGQDTGRRQIVKPL